MNLKNLLSIVIATSLFWGCVNSKKEKISVTYDITDLLKNASDNIIIPQLEELKKSSEELELAFSEFNDDPSASRLVSLKASYKNSYLKWQSCSFINFGSGSADYLAFTLNTFPVDVENINKFFNNSGDDLEWSEYSESRGYPGFDYILFEGSQEDIINRLTGHGNEYCTKNIELLKSYSTNNYKFWTDNEDNFYQEFITDISKTKTSPFTILVNAFCKDLEVLKNEQLKAPGGQEFFTFPLPKESEALYSGYSLDLFKAHLLNLERIYKGENLMGDNGIGFDDYLKFMGANKEDDDLNELILSTFSKIEELVNSLNGSINEAAANQKEIVDELYRNVKALVGYTKTDMTYAFGINITYADPQDGD